MDNLTIVIPYYEERIALDRLLATLPVDLPVIIVDDQSTEPLQLQRSNTKVFRPFQKGYFTGAVNFGLMRCTTDVLVLNQDVTLSGTAWLDTLAEHRAKYALIGERIKGDHPAFPGGYVHGVFQFMRRDAISKVGLMNEKLYPLWGASALWQLQICRKGFRSLPLESIPGLWHEPRHDGEHYGASIVKLLRQEPTKRNLYIRTPPLISVVIPCYNHGRYIEDAVNSLVGGKTSLGVMSGQTFQSFEIILVDDGSDAKTQEQMQAVTNDWEGIRYIRQRNKGTAGANNTGIRNSIGKYITILAADDMKEPWSLEELYQAATKHPEEYVYDAPTAFANGRRGKTYSLAPYSCEYLPMRNMVPAGIMYPREAWVQADGYPEEMVHGREDWAFNIALARAGWHGHQIQRSGYLYRRERQNRSLGNGDLREHFLTQLMRLFPDVYREGNMCCSGKGGGSASMTIRPTQSFNAASVPQGMAMLQYVGGNVGSQTWGGPGTVQSGRYYVFGNNPKDKIKFVDARDVNWFLALQENGKRIFTQYTEPEKKPLKTVPDNSAIVDWRESLDKEPQMQQKLTEAKASKEPEPAKTVVLTEQTEPTTVKAKESEVPKTVSPQRSAEFFKTQRGKPKSGTK